MDKRILNTTEAPAAIGPYSQGISGRGEICFVSGQLPIVPETGEFAGATIEAQTEQSLKNMEAVLKAGDMNLRDVVKTTVLLSDIQNFGKMNEVYAQFFKEECPARAAFEVAALPKGALVEIEAVALKETK